MRGWSGSWTGQKRASITPALSLILALREVGAQVAQLVEHVTENHGVGGSIPPLGTTKIPTALQTGACFTPSSNGVSCTLTGAFLRQEGGRRAGDGKAERGGAATADRRATGGVRPAADALSG